MNNYVRLTDDDRVEQVPETLRDETMQFVDAFREAQGERNAQIGRSAHALGSDLTAPYGGLHGPSEYTKSRYQVPQTESRLAALRTSAQLDALNKLMQNDIARYQDLVSQASRNAARKAAASKTSTTEGKVLTDEILPETANTTLGTAVGEYTKEEAPYGITRIYGQGSFDGTPLYIDTLNDENGNPTGNVINRNDGISVGQKSSEDSGSSLSGATGTAASTSLPSIIPPQATLVGRALAKLFGGQ